MERKRKMPARAAARVEKVAKRRQSTPRERSETPVPSPHIDEPPPPPPLPRSVQAGKPLPTTEDAQSENLSSKEFQSIGESGVLAESLTRSRQKWISEGYFEKYWTKPHKRKGVLNEDPKNPPKDSMIKVGTVTITIEPHIIEATMFTVKESKSRPQHGHPQQTSVPNIQARPIIQYGPPNGVMPSLVPAEPLYNAQTSQLGTSPTYTPSTTGPLQAPTGASQLQTAASSATLSQGSNIPPRPPSLPAGLQAPSMGTPPPGIPGASNPSFATTAASSSAITQSMPSPSTVAAGAAGVTASPGQPKPTTPISGATTPGAKATTNDPVIALLAQRASTDPQLRDLMKRVAVGQAKGGELQHFQKIIDQLNAEYKKSGGQQGPSADRLLVDGKTVKYFADEVKSIIDIVLTSNPNQKASDLRVPPGSNPLVVLLVKTALEDTRTKNMIKRIAEGRPGFTDATDLKDILDRRHKDAKAAPQSAQPAKASPATSHGFANGQAKPMGGTATTHPNPQALRSKGPPPAPKFDVSAVVFDFGTGDRYQFPKFSVLEYLHTPPGQQVVASFLIVRKGSDSEYGGNPDLDYYEPVTVRLYTPSGRHLENLARVVAPQEEVRRYMDDVMDNMTRAEYVLLAMRLPRTPRDGDKEGNGGVAIDESKTSTSTPQPEAGAEQGASSNPPVLWASSATNSVSLGGSNSFKPRDQEQESQLRYQRLINSVAAKDIEAV